MIKPAMQTLHSFGKRCCILLHTTRRSETVGKDSRGTLALKPMLISRQHPPPSFSNLDPQHARTSFNGPRS